MPNLLWVPNPKQTQWLGHTAKDVVNVVASVKSWKEPGDASRIVSLPQQSRTYHILYYIILNFILSYNLVIIVT